MVEYIEIAKKQAPILKKLINLGIDTAELGGRKREIFKYITKGQLPIKYWFVIMDAIGTANSELTREEKKEIAPLLVQSNTIFNEKVAKAMEDRWEGIR